MCYPLEVGQSSGVFCSNQNQILFISIFDPGNKNRHFKLNQEVFLTLTRWFLSLKLTSALEQKEK